MQEHLKATATDPRLSVPLARRHARLLGELLLSALACLPLAAGAQSGAAAGGGLRLPGVSRPEAPVTPAQAATPDASPASTPSDAGRASRAEQAIDRIIAVVNQGVITQSELDAQLRLVETRAAARDDGVLPPRDELRKQVLEQMILQLAQEQFAAEYGLKPTEAELDRAAADVAQNNGMSPSQLVERLKAEGVSFEGFRRQLAAEIVAVRLRERETAQNVSISEGEVDAELTRSGQISEPEFNVRQILVKVPEGAAAQEVGRLQRQAETLTARARKGENFATLAAERTGRDASDAASGSELGWRTASRLPSLFADAVRKMSPGEVSAPLRSPAGFHILKLQDKRAGQAASVQLTHVRHILLPVDTPEAEAEAERRLQRYRSEIDAGTADFATLARDFSADGSAAKGGDLGWIHPGETVPEFEKAMNALRDGEVSEPVRSSFGLHLIQVLGRRTDAESPERLRNAARQKLRDAKGAEAYEQWLKELRDRTYVEYRNQG